MPLPRTEPDIGRLLVGASGPALVVRLDDCRVIAANYAAQDWVDRDGVERHGLAVPPEAGTILDAAMPAVHRLRQLSHAVEVGHRSRERLTFWTRRGVRTVLCEVTIARETTGQKLAFAEMMAVDVDADPDQNSRVVASAGPRDDAATLRAIARRIRAGQFHWKRRTGRDAEPDRETRTMTMGTSQPAGDATAACPGQSNGPGTLSGGGALAAPSEAIAEGTPENTHGIRLAKLAHELKTPLSAIVAAAEIMRDQRLGPIEDARYRSYAADIYDSARHALLVIGSMLGDADGTAASRSGPLVPQMVFAELDLNPIVESCGSSMRPLAESAGLSLSLDLAQRLPHVVADPTAVRQIVLNLLNNAVKFTGPAGRITLVTRYAADGQVEIEVCDTGRGMTQEEIERAGGGGGTASGPVRREGGGLGIGLPLVGALASLNGAGLAISSRPGQGTRVVVAFGKDRVIPV